MDLISKIFNKEELYCAWNKRRSSSPNSQRIDDIYEEIQKKNKRFILHYGDLTDFSNLNNLISKIRPNEVIIWVHNLM